MTQTNPEGELEQAMMEAIVGIDPIDYSEYGQQRRAKLYAAIQAYAAQAADKREQEVLEWAVDVPETMVEQRLTQLRQGRAAEGEA